ncbi:MAG: hypothetical protein PWQ74_733 [Methanobacteriaceae archaeon]|nr:hypothetical protein [Methanobacteriaceae archaeon]
MGTNIKLIFYFILGGIVVSLTTYFGSKEKGVLAAFIAMFPSVTVLTLSTIYLEAGMRPVLSYLKGLLILTPVWIIYLICLVYMAPKHGFWPALVSGVALYLILAWLITFVF